MKPAIKLIQTGLWIAFIMYIFIAFRLIFWKSWGGFSYISQCYSSFDNWRQEVSWNLNLIPLRFIFDTQGYTPITWCKNVIGNIVLFIPTGFFALCLFSKGKVWSFKKYTFTMAAIIICIELLQLFFMCGNCDIDDFILNLLGACLGFKITLRALKN